MAPVFGRHHFFGTSEHYGKAHGSLLSIIQLNPFNFVNVNFVHERVSSVKNAHWSSYLDYCSQLVYGEPNGIYSAIV